jgi:hypothetical protein
MLPDSSTARPVKVSTRFSAWAVAAAVRKRIRKKDVPAFMVTSRLLMGKR